MLGATILQDNPDRFKNRLQMCEEQVRKLEIQIRKSYSELSFWRAQVVQAREILKGQQQFKLEEDENA